MVNQIINKNQLLQLRSKIENNTASLEEYKDYEAIILKSGKYTHEDIASRLKKYGYNSWEEYYKSRQTELFEEPKKGTEGAILGTILGLSLALIVIWALTGATKSGGTK